MRDVSHWRGLSFGTVPPKWQRCNTQISWETLTGPRVTPDGGTCRNLGCRVCPSQLGQTHEVRQNIDLQPRTKPIVIIQVHLRGGGGFCFECCARESSPLPQWGFYSLSYIYPDFSCQKCQTETSCSHLKENRCPPPVTNCINLIKIQNFVTSEVSLNCRCAKRRTTWCSLSHYGRRRPQRRTGRGESRSCLQTAR